jgi:hypothetical protein
MSWVQRATNWMTGSRSHNAKSRPRAAGSAKREKSYRNRCLTIESLEARTLLSAAPFAAIGIEPASPKDVSADPIFVNGIRGAYGLGSYTASVLTGGISFDGVPGDGRGQTIAIVDAYDYPTALYDVNKFSANFGLPQFNTSGGPTFQKLTQTGQPVSTSPSSPNYVATDPNGPGSSDWEGEESLDIEWAHAIAPMANIDLFEGSNDSNNIADLFTAVQTADNTPGVVCVSMSWSGDDSLWTAGQIATYNSTDFVTPAGHIGGAATMGGTDLAGGITYFVASGDNGAYGDGDPTPGPEFPSDSPNVVSVGGTTLTVDGSNPNYTYGGETAWGNGLNSGTFGGSGGGISTQAQPSYQSGIVNKYSTTKRTFPDVAMEADPATGVPIYDSYDNGTASPWTNFVGGTSLATPMWAGLVAIADEGRAIAGLGSLNGLTQTLPELYSLPSTDFHDITSGSTGPAPTYVAGTGYDLTTGLGSPVANKLIPGLINYTPSVTSINPATGPSTGGTVVTIAGTNLTGGTVVDFGSTPATNVMVVSATEIMATSPAGTGSVYVTVTGPGGVSATAAANQFTYLTGPVVTSVTPPAAPLAGGTTVTIAGAGFTGATAVDFGTTLATHYTVVSATQITATVPAGSGTVDVTVVTSQGTSPKSSADQITYDGTPTITGVSPSYGALGGGTTVTITGTNLAGATLVDFGTKGATIKSNTDTQIVVTSPSGTGTVNITVTDPGGTSATVTADQFIYVGPPTVATAASATPSPVTGLTTNLSVLGADSLGESILTYTWSATALPTGAAAPTYSANGTNSSKNTIATFSQAGSYTFTVTISDGGGQTVTSSVTVTVNQTFTTIDISPTKASIYEGQTQQFTATANDQFGAAMSTQPTFTWSRVSGVGSISATGLFSSPSAYGSTVISATSGSVSETANVTVLSDAPTIVTAAAATPSPVMGTTTGLSVSATDEQGGTDLTYTWSTTSKPSGAAGPTFNVNGTSTAQNTTATFTRAGNYTFLVTVVNSLKLTATSSVVVTVEQTLTTISVKPSSASPYVGATLQFSAAGYDQFGAALASQPAFSWSTTVGQISSTGLLTAASSVTSGTVTATSGTVSQSSTVNVRPLPTINAAYVVPDPVEPSLTSLFVYGTGSSDTILVNPATGAGVPKGSVTVLINGVSRGTFDPTGRIVIHGVAGNETIGVSPLVTTPAFIYGGNGNDTLWGGGGPNMIVGGTGSNKLYGGVGRSVLIAGPGASLLSAGGGDAILLAGTTIYNANDAALLAILDEWNSNESYATRSADIEGTGNDPLAQNGPYYLNASTVHSNGLVNHLATSGGLALFFQNSRDIVAGKTASEISVAIT